MAPASRAALISVDARPAALFAEGEQLADGVVLVSINPNWVVVKRGNELLQLPVRGNGSPASAAGGLDVAAPAFYEAPLTRGEERRTYQNRD
jgi:hypothetical protein